MGCTNAKQKKEQKDPNKVRKPNAYLAEDKFWDDPSIKDNKQREQTIASIENIHYFYKFERKLGSGSFGSVTLGIPLNDPDKRVAIKTIQKESVQGIPQHYLKREVDIIKSLDHPNICKFLETYMDKENIYLVMEYCAGGTLKELIYSQNNNEFAVAKIMQKLFWAVNYMHNNNIVHRDLKLENVIFSTTNPATSDIKIIDFGLSKKVHDKQKRRHTKVGSFNYMGKQTTKQASKLASMHSCWKQTSASQLVSKQAQITFEILSFNLFFDNQKPQKCSSTANTIKNATFGLWQFIYEYMNE